MKGDKMNIQINPKFRDLLPALSDEKYAQLEQNLMKSGCREPLTLWGDVIIDGHNRFEICTNNEIEFKTVQEEFESEDDAIDWMIDNQLGRRDLTDNERRYFRGLQHEREKKKQGTNNQFIKSEKRHNDGFQSTSEKLAIQHNVSPRTIERDAVFAKGVDKIATVNPELKEEILSGSSDFTKKEIIEIAKAPVEKIPEIIEAKKPHVSNNSGNNEWYTPAEYIDIARAVMGSIDCDPASSEIANKTVCAETFYTYEDDGLEKDWNGNVWMNPPYAQPLINQFSEKLIGEIENGNINEACVLVNNATETRWFQTMAEKAKAIWFVKTRVKFIDVYGNPNGAPLQGQCFLYFGSNVELLEKKCNGLVFVNKK